MAFQSLIESQLAEAARVLEAFLADKSTQNKIETAAQWLAESITQGGKIISCGNGGSHCDAMHFAEELTGRFRDDRRAFPAIAISDPAYMSCVGNDYGFEHVFSRFVEGMGRAEDVLFCLSTSGNSANVLRAAEAAKAKGMRVIALTGNDGGKLAPLADLEIRVPHQGYADRIQEVHIKVIHILILLVEKILP